MRFLIAAALVLCVSSLAHAGLEFRDAVIKIYGDKGQGSAVCVSEEGLFVTIGHNGFRIGWTYHAEYDDGSGRQFDLRCVFIDPIEEYQDEEIVLLKSVEDEGHKFTYVNLGTLPSIGDQVYATGYTAGRFYYAEGIVLVVSDKNTTITTNYRMFEGASGGGLLDQHDRLIGIIQSRSLMPSETIIQSSSPKGYCVSSKVVRESVKQYREKKNG